MNEEYNFNKVGGSSSINVEYNPTIEAKAHYRIIDSKHNEIDSLQGQDVITNLECTNWKDFFEYYKEQLQPKKTYIVVKVKLGDVKGTPVYTYTKSTFLSGLNKKEMSGGMSGLSDIMQGFQENNLSGLSALQDEISNKNVLISNLNDQISSNWQSLDNVRTEFKQREIELLDKMKAQEIKIKELEQELKMVTWQHETETKYNKLLDKANSSDMSQYMPLISGLMDKFGSTQAVAPVLSGAPQPQPQKNYTQQNIEMDEAEYVD